MRGRIGSILLLSYNSGILASYIIGACVSYQVYPYIGIVLPIVYPILAVLIPETPQSLIKNNRIEDARRAHKFYRGFKKNDKLPSEYSDEFEQILSSTLISQQDSKVSLSDFSESSFFLFSAKCIK